MKTVQCQMKRQTFHDSMALTVTYIIQASERMTLEQRCVKQREIAVNNTACTLRLQLHLPNDHA